MNHELVIPNAFRGRKQKQITWFMEPRERHYNCNNMFTLIDVRCRLGIIMQEDYHGVYRKALHK